jgi:hypothetical protein
MLSLQVYANVPEGGLTARGNGNVQGTETISAYVAGVPRG